MELSDLTHDERLALVALVETVVASDAAVSEDEQAHIAQLAGLVPWAVSGASTIRRFG